MGCGQSKSYENSTSEDDGTNTETEHKRENFWTRLVNLIRRKRSAHDVPRRVPNEEEFWVECIFIILFDNKF